MNNGKELLILEKSSVSLNVNKKGSDEYILEGIFAEFGVENNNNRIYEESEYLPHFSYLKKKVESKKLLGELDHPEQFDVSLSKVSHVVEELEYDKKTRTVRGKIRLLDTPSGKIAKTLVDSGIPIHISSRAAGEVKENKKVVIKRIFTYDIVAEPGFESATLKKVNESYGFSNNDEYISIYEIGDKNKQEEIEYKNKKNIMEKYVSNENLQKYSEHIKREFDSLKRSVEKSLSNSSNNDRILRKIEKLEERLNSSLRYSDYLAEKLSKSIQYSEYIAENTNSPNIDLNKKIERLIKYCNYLSEKLDKSILYSEHLDEHNSKKVNRISNEIDKLIKYAEYIAENASEKKDVQNLIKYAEYIAENASEKKDLENLIEYAEYIAENASEKKDFNKLVEYTEMMMEKLQPESFVSLNSIVDKSLYEQEKYYENLSGKIDRILENANKEGEKQMENKYPFLRFLSESKIKEFNSLSETEKERVSKALTKNPRYNEQDILKIWERALKEVEINEKWFVEMPKEYVEIWESLDPAKKELIIKQSKLYSLDTPYKIKNFWDTRNLIKTSKLNENMQSEISKNMEKPIDNTVFSLGYSQDYIKNIQNKLKTFKK